MDTIKITLDQTVRVWLNVDVTDERIDQARRCGYWGDEATSVADYYADRPGAIGCEFDVAATIADGNFGIIENPKVVSAVALTSEPGQRFYIVGAPDYEEAFVDVKAAICEALEHLPNADIPVTVRRFDAPRAGMDLDEVCEVAAKSMPELIRDYLYYRAA